MQIGSVTISTALAWLIGAAAALITLSKAVELLKNIFSRARNVDIIKKHSEQLDNDNRRIKKLEEEITKLSDAQPVMFRGLLSIINHELTGNGDDVLRHSRDEINNFLTGR